MLKNYIKIALRTLKKNSGFAVINILGLTTGIAACLLLLLYAHDELSYDKFHENGESIYRIAGSYNQGGDERNESAQTTFLLGPKLESFSGIEHWTRLQLSSGVLRYEEKIFQENSILFADSSFFEIFSYPLLQGTPETVIDHVNSIVISQKMATKYFGNQEAVGKTLLLDGIALKVTGIMNDFPKNSHLYAEFVVSMSTAIPFYPDWVLTNATGTSHLTYIKTTENTNPSSIASQLAHFVEQAYDDRDDAPRYFLQPLEEIHLNSNLSGEISANGDRVYVYIFLTIAIIVFAIACINYTNMAIARSSTRSKEVGLRKVAGASRGQLIFQHLTESIMLAVIAVLLGGLATELLLPYFNQISGKEIEQSIITNLNFVFILLGIGVLAGVLAGIYPAFYLSKFKAIKILKTESINLKRGTVSFRKILIVFQFTATAVLIIGTLLINKQLNYLHNQKLGINTDGVLYFTMPTPEIRNKYESLKNDLLNLPECSFVTASNNNPVARVGSWREYKLGEKNITIPTIVVDHHYFETLEAEMQSGRTFSQDIKSDETQAYVLNEAAAQLLELEKGVGTQIEGRAFTGSEWSLKDATVIGIVKDFHFTSLHSKIQPAVFSLQSEITTPMFYVMVRYNSTNTQKTITKINSIWNDHANGRPINLTFMDDAVQQLYNSEQRFLQLYFIFSIIALVIASLGALALVSYTVSQMTKQIGVRKVLGASVFSIVKLVNVSFFRMLVLAFLISIPVSYYFIDGWLEGFAYKITIGWLPFVKAALLLLVIAVVTTSSQSIKAALTNPVDTLKEE